MKTIVLDYEIHVNAPGKDPGWWHPANSISLEGMYEVDTDKIIQAIPTPGYKRTGPKLRNAILVGHNLAFDIGWLSTMYTDKQEFMKFLEDPSIILWDTMLVEYLLTAQNAKGDSLGLKELCVRYGISEEWSVDFEDVSSEDLRRYNELDLRNTYKLMQYQQSRMTDSMIGFIASQMRMQKSTICASIRGICFDRYAADKEKTLLEMEITSLKADLEYEMRSSSPVPILEWNVESTQDLGLYLFGGVKIYELDVPVVDDNGDVVHYKSGIKKGLVKTKKGEVLVNIPPAETSVSGTTTASGRWAVDTEVLAAIDSDFTRKVLVLRDLKKQATTYYDNLIKYSDSFDGRIHPQFNHTVTATGRLSSSKPNLQNIRGER